MTTPKDILRSTRGFLLLEVLASLMILAIGLTGLVPLMIGSVRGVDLARSTTVANDLALDQMEAIRNAPYPPASGSDTVTPADLPTDFKREWHVDGGPAPGTKRITVTVKWTSHTDHGGSGKDHSVSLLTIVAQP